VSTDYIYLLLRWKEYTPYLFVRMLCVSAYFLTTYQSNRKLFLISDLKPDNVGFNFEGRVKLFDFGLAKELDPLQKTADGTCQSCPAAF
jgi:serine/threonine protein kinase